MSAHGGSARFLLGGRAPGSVYPEAIIILVCILGLLTVCAGCLLLSGEPYEFHSGSDFDMRIQASEPIRNATFYIPLPVQGGVPAVGDTPLFESDFEKTGYRITFSESPPDLNLSDAYPVPDSRLLFVRINADIMEGDPGYLRANTTYEVTRDKVDFHDNPRQFFQTLYPMGNESVFLPKFSFTLPAPESERGNLNPGLIGYKNSHIPQMVPIFADYTASPSAEVSVYLYLNSYNGWRQQSTSHGNEYTDFVYWETRGESHGWQHASGEFHPGVGVYPDYSHPAWKSTVKEFQLEKNG